jgi:hypothetical protein
MVAHYEGIGSNQRFQSGRARHFAENYAMPDDPEYMIVIYHNGVQFEAPVRGQERYLKEKAFLDDLIKQYYAPELLPRPIPDPPGDFYALNDEQLAAYSAFRRNSERDAG